ncbi:MAG: hypothetical protein U0168_17205 [Nannocystaceae bacterium]|jgi:hypothetical protein
MSRARAFACLGLLVGACYQRPEAHGPGAGTESESSSGSSTDGDVTSTSADGSGSSEASGTDSDASSTADGSSDGGCVPASYDDVVWDAACFR